MNNYYKTNGEKKTFLWDFDFVHCSKERLFGKLGTDESGLTEQEAKRRLKEFGPNEPAKRKKDSVAKLIFFKLINPLVLVLFVIGGFSIFFGEIINASLVFIMAIMSVVLAFVQEYRAGRASERLLDMVHTTATVCRRGKVREVRLVEIVPGDIVNLSAGDMIPADVRILSSKDFFVNQASFTGESFPVEKMATPVDGTSLSINDHLNIAFMGTSVVSGSAVAAVIKTGSSTQFGELFIKLGTLSVASSFDKGVRQFTMLLVKAMLCLVVCIFAIINIREGNVIEAFLFSLGVAVGLTPEMLPMIVTVTLSKGAIALSEHDVIVKRLNSIQNFGAMDVLCTDKTGTLTEDKITLEKHCDVRGREDEDVLRHAYINSFYQTGLKNVLDKAILRHEKLLMKEYVKIDEIPFDFSRKIMSVVVKTNGNHLFLSKGAPEEVWGRCSHYELDGLIQKLDDATLSDLKKEYAGLSAEGFRVLFVAYKTILEKKETYSRDDEKDLILKGYVAFFDPPKPTAKKAIEALRRLGIDFKVLTGDNELVTKKICSEVGLAITELVTGDTVEKSTDEELKAIVETTNVFTRLMPMQKERVIRALHENGHVVGYLGDGINDAPALKTSDVGISVNNAVDISKESADLILLKKSLMVLQKGVLEGRKTFGNILKYIKMGSSSNFGNMLSMTGASLFLPFLPMLPIQILLNNLLYDMSQIAIPTDGVDREYLVKPRPWNIDYIKKFMLIIGPISSIFDFITFGVMLYLFHFSAVLFHTGWFIESLVTQTLVIHVIRTGKIPFLQSMPSRFLIVTSLLIVCVGLVIPLLPIAKDLGFAPLPATFYVALALIAGSYFLLVQAVKSWFVKKFGS
jgi:Mg2+-importing ATPase